MPRSLLSLRQTRLPGLLLTLLSSSTLAGSLSSVAPPLAYGADQATPPRGLAEEISLDGLGIGVQTVRGAGGSVTVSFPAPDAPLAASGSFARVSFGHSVEVATPSRVDVSINGGAPTSIAISPGTAAGSIHEIGIPVQQLHSEQPNKLEVHFWLAAQAGAAGSGELFGRLDGQTLLHYQVGSPGDSLLDPLQTYPYSLLGTFLEPHSTIGLVLPTKPDPAEVAAGLRVIADVSRQAWSREVDPVLVTSGQERWLATAGYPALVVGRLTDLPVAAAGLRAADAGSANPQPDPLSAIGRDEGIIAAPRSLDNSPEIVLTGRTDEAVAAAAEALVNQPSAGLTGPVVVTSPLAQPVSIPPRTLALSSVMPDDEAVEGQGDHRLAFGVSVPPTDRTGKGFFNLAISASSAAGSNSPSAGVEVNGRAIGGGTLAPGTDRITRFDLNLPGGLLRQGMDGIVVNLTLPPADPGVPSAASAGARILANQSMLSLPPAPTSPAGLASLPYPFLDIASGSSATVMLAGPYPDSIEAAAKTMAALGSHSTSPPPRLQVRKVGQQADGAPVGGNIIVVGARRTRSGNAPDLELHLGATGSVAISPLSPVVGRAAGSKLGWIEMVDLPRQGVRMLWVGGIDGQSTELAGQALYNRDLTGEGTIVLADGRANQTPVMASPVSRSIEVRIADALVWVVLAVLIVGVRVVPDGARPDLTGSQSRWNLLGMASCAVALLAWGGIAAGIMWWLAAPTAAHLFYPALAVVALLPVISPPRRLVWLTAFALSVLFVFSQAALSSQPVGVELGGALPATYLPGALRSGLAGWATPSLGAGLLMATAGVAEFVGKWLRPTVWRLV